MKQTIKSALRISICALGLMTFPAQPQENCDQAPRNVTVDALVNIGLQCHPGLQAQAARLQSRRYLVDTAGRLADPSIMTGVVPQSFTNDNLAEGYIVEVNQKLPWPGVLNQQKNVAYAEVDMVAAEREQLQVEVAKHIRLHIAELYLNNRLLDINQQHLELLNEVIRLSENKYGAGTGSKAAILQAMHEHHRLQEQTLVLNGKRQRANDNLSRWLPFPLTPDQLSNLQLPVIADVIDPTRLLTDLRQQPQIKQLSAQQQKKQLELNLAEKDRYPEFSLMTRYNSLWQEEDLRWVVGVGVNLPFDFGKRSARENSLKAEQLSLRWQEQDVMQALENSIKQHYSQWQQAQTVARLYRDEFLPLANELLITARDDYQSGRGDFLTLLTAQQQNLDTQSKALVAETETFKTASTLLAAMGLSDWQALASTGEQQ